MAVKVGGLACLIWILELWRRGLGELGLSLTSTKKLIVTLLPFLHLSTKSIQQNQSVPKCHRTQMLGDTSRRLDKKGFFTKNTHIHTHTIYMHLFIYWPYMVCGILVPEPGIQPAPPALEGQGLSHWTTKEVPSRHCFRMWGSHRKSLYLWNLPSNEWETKEK